MFITPAIFPENFEQLIDKLFLLEGLCDRVQIDLCDGVFGLEKTWLPYKEGEELPSGFSYEIDLMVVDWKKYLIRVLPLQGVTRVVMHIDTFTDSDITMMLTLIAPYKIHLGLAVSNDIDVRIFARMINNISRHYSKVFVQVMGIQKIGAQGQPFDETVLAHIVYLKKECRHVEIQVDGSMNTETIIMVKNRGADKAVVGSYLFRQGVEIEDVKKTLETLERSVG